MLSSNTVSAFGLRGVMRALKDASLDVGGLSSVREPIDSRLLLVDRPGIAADMTARYDSVQVP